MSSGRPIRVTRRDRVIGAISNFLFRFASEDYRAFVGGAVQYGMRSAARDVKQGWQPPPHWDEPDYYSGTGPMGY